MNDLIQLAVIHVFILTDQHMQALIHLYLKVVTKAFLLFHGHNVTEKHFKVVIYSLRTISLGLVSNQIAPTWKNLGAKHSSE
jgi:hypothetical protein